MRPRTFLIPFMLLVLAACGGSSSETPWPAEPRGPALGPADESSPTEAATDAPEAVDDGALEQPDAGR